MDRQVKNSAGWTAATHNLSFAVQEYIMLHDQHQELCQRLHEMRPLLPTLTLTPSSLSLSSTSSSTASISLSLDSTTTASPSVSPSRSPGRKDAAAFSHPRSRGSRRSPVYDDSEMAAGQQKLFDVNEGLKRALTELLNCDAVRQDRAMRTWVQTRLMETEKELRQGRRRRSSATVE